MKPIKKKYQCVIERKSKGVTARMSLSSVVNFPLFYRYEVLNPFLIVFSFWLSVLFFLLFSFVSYKRRLIELYGMMNVFKLQHSK